MTQESEFSSADNDFLPDHQNKYAPLVKAMFNTDEAIERKAVLNRKQSVALSRAWAFAELMSVPALATLADTLANTTASINGLALKQMVEVMSARMSSDVDDSMGRLRRNMGL
jgi:hypothetical protein